MAKSNPDILLIVGANTGASYGRLKNDIEGVVKALNRNPPKIKVTIDDKDFQNKLNSLKKQISNIGSQKVTINLSNSLQGAVSSVGKSAAQAANQAAKIREALKLGDIDASVAKVRDKFEKLGDSGSEGLGKIKNNLGTISRLLLKLKDPQTFTDDSNLLSTYKQLNELLEKTSNKISVIQSRTNTAKKISFGIDTEKFKTDIDGIQRNYDALISKSPQLTQNIKDLNTAFTIMESGASTQDQRIAAYQKLTQLLPVITKQIRAQAQEEKSAAQAANQTNKKQVDLEREVNAQKKQAYELLTRINQAQKEWTKSQSGRTSNEYARLSTYINEINSALNGLSSKSLTSSDFVTKIKAINTEFTRTSSVIKNAGENTLNLRDRFGALSEKFSMWFSATRTIMMVYTNIKKMISASIELDKSLNQLQIVTKNSDEVMAKFGNTAADAAKKVGSSITDFVSSATTFARLGYSLEDSSKLAEYTAMLQNVGDIDASGAQEAMTSIIKAFNIEDMSQVESVMDKLVKTGNAFPISVSEIAEGMKNASSALAAAGNSYEQSVALLTAANTTINLCRVA